MIREINTAEFKELYLPLVEEHYNNLPAGNHVEFDPYTMIDMMNLCESNNQLNVIVDERDGDLAGIIIGMVIPSYMNISHWAAYNMIWYVFPKYRKTDTNAKLMQAYEAWAERKGIRDIQLGIASEHRGDMDKFFNRNGYTPYQTIYLKRIF